MSKDEKKFLERVYQFEAPICAFELHHELFYLLLSYHLDGFEEEMHQALSILLLELHRRSLIQDYLLAPLNGIPENQYHSTTFH